MLSEIPADLLLQVASEASKTDRKALRAVSKSLQAAIEPFICESSSLVLDVNKYPRSGRCPSQLETLGAGPTAWASCRRLIIRSLVPAGQTEGAFEYESTQILLRPALESLTGLHAVHWVFGKDDPQWAQSTVFQVLNVRKDIDELSLRNTGDRLLGLRRLSHVRSLRVWDVSYIFGRHIHTAPWIPELVRNIPSLESVYFPRDACAQICDTLLQEKIWLKNVCIQRWDEDSLLRYLASYSGLERLEIGYVYKETDAEMLFKTVLPKHAASLVALICPGYFEGSCSFQQRNIRLVSGMKKLETLEVSVNPSEIASDGSNGKRGIVELILEMAAELPALRNIAILASVGMSVGCGVGIDRAMDRSQGRIDQIMDLVGNTKRSAALASLIATHHRRVESIKNKRALGTKPIHDHGSMKH
ncbi:hypothetical protein DFH06DRAFT_1235078 [Mycena polygramma]|nr:hypothetical protein DFH06DRAFT_1235078 [Mycena polygramma]